jgi:hypothetical protein
MTELDRLLRLIRRLLIIGAIFVAILIALTVASAVMQGGRERAQHHSSRP